MQLQEVQTEMMCTKCDHPAYKHKTLNSKQLRKLRKQQKRIKAYEVAQKEEK